MRKPRPRSKRLAPELITNGSKSSLFNDAEGMNMTKICHVEQNCKQWIWQVYRASLDWLVRQKKSEETRYDSAINWFTTRCPPRKTYTSEKIESRKGLDSITEEILVSGSERWTTERRGHVTHSYNTRLRRKNAVGECRNYRSMHRIVAPCSKEWELVFVT